jgi:hypothetical protein
MIPATAGTRRKPTPIGADAAAAADSGQDTGTDQAGDADPAGDPDQASAAEAPAVKIEARILRHHGDYLPNTLALLSEAEAKSGEGDWCDTHPDAVAAVAALVKQGA